MTGHSTPRRCGPAARACAPGLVACISLLANARAVAQAVATNASGSLQEVVVTAERRNEPAQEVPLSLQVLSGAELERSGAHGFKDYLDSISSVGFTEAGNGAVQIGIRGVSNVDGTDYGIAASKSAVGIYLDDVPIQGAGPLPDLALYDLDRIEVLKGPQGTLYGEGSMGGAIKMVLNAPNSSAFAAKADLGVSSTAHGGINYETQGALNLPLIENRLALRIVAGHTDNSGFIDNVVTGQNHIGGNSEDNYRALLNARMTDQLTAEVIALHQRLILHDFPEEVIGAGDLRSNFPDHQYDRQDFDLYALKLKYHLQAADLTSATAYVDNVRDFYQRNAEIGLFDGGALLDFGLPGVPESDPQGLTPQIDQQAITEELRAASVGNQRLTWTLGAFFNGSRQNAVSHDTFPDFQTYNLEMTSAAANPASTFSAMLDSLNATLPDALFTSATDVYENIVYEKARQYAVFGEGNYKITPKLSLRLGLRWFTETDSISQFNQALAIEALDFSLYGIPAASQSMASIADHAFAPRLGLSYSFDRNALVYAMASEGFRSGGPNFNDGHPQVAAEYKPDSLWQYELGTKTFWLERHLIANAAVYYINWKDVQVPATNLVYQVSYVANAGAARVTGGELELDALPSAHWRLGLNLGLLNSKITSLGPEVSGAVPGAELPDAPKATAAAFVQYTHELGGLGTGVARFDYQYVGREAVKLIDSTPSISTFYKDGYSTGRVQIGVDGLDWSTFLYVSNLWNERGVLDKSFYQLFGINEQTLTLIRPRTVGLRVSLSF